MYLVVFYIEKLFADELNRLEGQWLSPSINEFNTRPTCGVLLFADDIEVFQFILQLHQMLDKRSYYRWWMGTVYAEGAADQDIHPLT